MTEVWKSNPRKFCEFCKCWIADNRPSVEFHERGKRHIENVKIKIDDVARKGKETYENNKQEGDFMRQMEEAALLAYQKDIKNNPDFSGSKISEMAKEINSDIVVKGKLEKKEEELRKKEEVPPPKPVKKWHEAKSPEGYSYYWNKDTGESIWEKPTEGFVSIEDEKKDKEKKKKDKKQQKDELKKNKEEGKNNSEEKVSSSKKEKHKSKKHKNSDEIKIFNKKDLQKIEVKKEEVFGPVHHIQSFGSWEQCVEQKQPDLQLPKIEEAYIEYPTTYFKRPKITFEEKTVTLDSSSTTDNDTGFKKRKNADVGKRNIMQRRDL